MADEITLEKVNAKLAKGEALTAEENKFVMSLPPEGVPAAEEDKDIDWDKAEDLDKPKEGETPEEKKAREEKAAADKKKTELADRAKKINLPETATEEEIIAAEKTAEDAKDPLVKLETKLQETEKLSDEQIKLDDTWSDREKAYFWQMRKDRKKRQQAEEERDAARFREIQRETKEKAEGKEEKVEDPLAEFKKRDQDDFMTVADVVAAVEKILKAKPPKKEEAAPSEAVIKMRVKFLQLCDNEARATHPEDYDAVMELTEEIITSNAKYNEAIFQTIAEGKNPAEKSYELIKSDPEFAKLFPAAQTKWQAKQKKPDKQKTPEELKKEADAKAAEKALEDNKKKIKTTGNAGGESGGGEGETIEGYTVQQIVAMTPLQFAKLPQATRKKFLDKYGM
jgi:hypothetical protein